MSVRHVIGIWTGIAVFAWGVKAYAAPRVERLVVDGYDVAVSAAAVGRGVEIGAVPGTVSFHFAPDQSRGNLPVRFRYKLEGRDAEWREAESEMRLVVLFFDDNNEWVAETSFLMKGESAGWAGSVDVSPMIPRREPVVVPKRASRFTVSLISAGPPTAVGTVALGALAVSKVCTGSSALPPVLELVFPPETVAAPTLQPPDGWGQRGLRPSMAQVLRTGMAPGGVALGIVDTDDSCHAEWQSSRIMMDAGGWDLLQLEWRESFSIGLAGVKYVNYGGLQPGHYVLRLKEVSPEGREAGEAYALSLVVKPPVWQRPWFLALCGICSAGLMFGVARFLYWRRMKRELARLKARQALEEERTRIARDIHDDLGATLTHISMLSQPVAPARASYAEVAETMERINRAAREMTQSMDEIVWAVNPKHDRLDHLVTFFDSYAQEFLASAGIDFRSDYPMPVPPLPVAAAVRHNLFLAFKEALANAARHSGCRTVCITLTVKGVVVILSVSDDGKGMSGQAGGRVGNGLGNMRRRVEGMGGRFSLESVAGRGVTVIFEVPLEG